MSMSDSHDSNEAVYDEIRERIARNADLRKARRGGRGAVRAARAWMTRNGERTAEWLERPRVLSLAGCLCVVLAGMSAFLIHRAHRNGELQADAPPPRTAQTVTAHDVFDYPEEAPETVAEVRQIPEPAETTAETVADVGDTSLGAADDVDDTSLEAEPDAADASLEVEPDAGAASLETPETPIVGQEAFIVRVGSFRDPSNAARVVASLKEQPAEVRTEILADGLLAVFLGPFPQKGAAEDSARSVGEAMGLTPQVLRMDPQ